MKRALVFGLVLIFAIGLVITSCGGKENQIEKTTIPENTQEEMTPVDNKSDKVSGENMEDEQIDKSNENDANHKNTGSTDEGKSDFSANDNEDDLDFRILKAIGRDNWNKLTDKEKSDILEYLAPEYEETDEKKINRIQVWYHNSRISNELYLAEQLVTECEAKIATDYDAWTDIKEKAPIEIIITIQGVSMSPSFEIQALGTLFSPDSYHTEVENHKIVIHIDEKMKVTSELLDIETGETPESLSVE
ncbi:MAG: hypothetical protein K6G45_12265 [Lachnospiraceae bacterium]|nr:hypothetical protein [Lachnospiraceae bacterium]